MLRLEDLRIDEYRHAGGSNVEPYWMVVVTHLPTGTVASCAEFKTRIANKLEAVKRLESNLKRRQAA